MSTPLNGSATPYNVTIEGHTVQVTVDGGSAYNLLGDLAAAFAGLVTIDFAPVPQPPSGDPGSNDTEP